MCRGEHGPQINFRSRYCYLARALLRLCSRNGRDYAFARRGGPTLDATCTATGTTQILACGSWSSTVTAGNAGTCYVTGVSGGNRLTGTMVDSANGFWDNVFGVLHPSSADSWTTTATMRNMATASPSPRLYFSNTPSAEATINCYAWKGVPASNFLIAAPLSKRRPLPLRTQLRALRRLP